MKETLREKINKDDGSHYKIGNHALNTKEIIGYISLILSMLIYLIADKAGFQYYWLGWLFLVVGFILVYFGIKQHEINKKT